MCADVVQESQIPLREFPGVPSGKSKNAIKRLEDRCASSHDNGLGNPQDPPPRCPPFFAAIAEDYQQCLPKIPSRFCAISQGFLKAIAQAGRQELPPSPKHPGRFPHGVLPTAAPQCPPELAQYTTGTLHDFQGQSPNHGPRNWPTSPKDFARFLEGVA